MQRFLVAFVLLIFPYAVNAVIIYSDRTTFESALGSSLTDDYSAPGYFTGDKTDLADLDIHSDANMSAVLGETSYTTTGFVNQNVFFRSFDPSAYCAGCNGSYELDFTSTSVGTGSGVFGVGLDIVAALTVFGTTAFVTFGDGTADNFAIPDANTSTGDKFWGITADQLISSIHFGLVDGGTNTNNAVQRMAMDNLTIGSASVPEPGTLGLLGAGLLGFVFARRKKAV